MLEEKTNKSIYHLMLVTEDQLGNLIDQDADENEWQKLRNLSPEKKDIVLSNELVQRMMLMQEQFRLNDTSVGKINILIRKIFFGELSLAECEAKIGSMLVQTGGGDPNQARAIVEFIQREILTIQPKPDAEEAPEEAKAVTVNMPLLQALSKYENLGNQLITEDRIRIKSQPDPVRPSLLYWLKCYREELGVGYHDNVQRGRLLFHSENGKKLSAEERERINLILKSVEENFPLSIDTERQEIIFPVFRGVLAGEQKAPPVSPSVRVNQGAATFVPARGTHTEYVTGGSARIPSWAGSVSDGSARIDTRSVSDGLRIGRGTAPSVTPERTAPPVEIGSVNFSTAHVFPAEKEVAERRFAPPRAFQGGAVAASQTELRPTPHPMSRSAAQPAPEQPVSEFAQRSAEHQSAEQQNVASRPPTPKPATSDPNPFYIHPVSLGRQGEQKKNQAS